MKEENITDTTANSISTDSQKGFVMPSRFHNMDMTRMVLCIIVFTTHFLAYNGIENPLPINVFNVGFFALSGFLAYRTFSKAPSTPRYLAHRFTRLMTPYCLSILIIAVLLCAVSSLSPGEYFTAPKFYKYLLANLTTLNFIEPELPGVFDTPEHALTVVNGTLWTMKVEIMLFLTFPIYMWFDRRFPRKRNVILVCIIFASLFYRGLMDHLYFTLGDHKYEFLGRQLLGQLAWYYMGVFTYLNLENVLKYKWWILGGIVLLAMFKFFVHDFYCGNMIIICLGALWLSVSGNFGRFLERKGNITYMIYLCHTPLIQMGVHYHISESIPHWICYLLLFAATALFGKLIMHLSDRMIASRRLQPVYKY